MPTPTEDVALRNAALGHLARREHSRQELVRKLSAQFAEVPPAALAAVLDDLAANGYQSDARFAESYVRFRAHKGFGPVRLQSELRERGVAPEVSETALTTFEANSPGWNEICADVRARKFGPPVMDRTQEIKQIRYLLYRGFSHDQARAALAARSETP